MGINDKHWSADYSDEFYDDYSVINSTQNYQIQWVCFITINDD